RRQADPPRGTAVEPLDDTAFAVTSEVCTRGVVERERVVEPSGEVPERGVLPHDEDGAAGSSHRTCVGRPFLVLRPDVLWKQGEAAVASMTPTQAGQRRGCGNGHCDESEPHERDGNEANCPAPKSARWGAVSAGGACPQRGRFGACHDDSRGC